MGPIRWRSGFRYPPYRSPVLLHRVTARLPGRPSLRSWVLIALFRRQPRSLPGRLLQNSVRRIPTERKDHAGGSPERFCAAKRHNVLVKAEDAACCLTGPSLSRALLLPMLGFVALEVYRSRQETSSDGTAPAVQAGQHHRRGRWRSTIGRSTAPSGSISAPAAAMPAHLRPGVEERHAELAGDGVLTFRNHSGTPARSTVRLCRRASVSALNCRH